MFVTINEIKKQVRKWWGKHHLYYAYMHSEDIFPLYFSLPKISAKHLQQNFSEIRLKVQKLVDESKRHKQHSFYIQYHTINHRLIGTQSIPRAIYFETREDLLRWLGQYRTFSLFCRMYQLTCNRLPQLLPFLHRNVTVMIQNMRHWSEIISVCQYFLQNPEPDLYIRQLDIEGVDSKFIEHHLKVLKPLLDFLLPDCLLENKPNQLAHHGFERRFGLKYPEPLIRFRFLDRQLIPLDLPVSDCTVTLSEFKQLDLPLKNIFITENKINGLAFPESTLSIVIFGLGYGVDSLADISWWHNKNIYYWGDIDSHGFAILSRLRSHYPQIKSVLMDQQTWDRYESLCVEESQHQRCYADLTNLTEAEQQVYQQLLQSASIKPVRLEQERLPYCYCVERLRQLEYSEHG